MKTLSTLPECVNTRETIREYILNYKVYFDQLTEEEKKKFTVLALNDCQNFDTYDLTMNLDRESIEKLLYRHVILEEITAEEVISLMLKNILLQHLKTFDKEFSDEFSEHLAKEEWNFLIKQAEFNGCDRV